MPSVIAAFAATGFDLAVAVIYLAISMGIGVAFAGKQSDLKTYLLAGAKMHSVMVAISIMAALFSGVSFLGAPAEGFNHNLVLLWGTVAFFIATPIATLVFLPLFFRLKLYTAYQYLEIRFDMRMRRLASALFIFRVLLWLALATYAPSLVIAEILGISLWSAVLITGICTTIYTAVGGMRAVIFTDVMQFCVLMGGIIVILVVAIGEIPGGVAGAWRIAEEGGRTRIFDFSWSLTERVTFWGALIGGTAINLGGLVTDQVSVQRYMTAASLKESQKALWVKLALVLPVLGLFYATGLVLFSVYQLQPELAATLTSADRLLPNFVVHRVGSPVPGLLVAAILAASMSTISSGINALTTTTLMDFFYARKTVASSAVAEQGRVRTARWWSFFFGIIITVTSLFMDRLGTLLEAPIKIGGLLSGPLLGVFLLGALSSRANATGTLIGAIIGTAAVVAVAWFTAVSFMWYSFAGTVVTYFAGWVASHAFPPPNAAQLHLTHAAQREK